MSSGSQRICVCACVCASHMCVVGMRAMQCQLQNPANPRNVGYTYICDICNFETAVAMLFYIFGKNFNQFSKNYSYIFSVAFWAYGFQNKRWIMEAISSKQNSTHILRKCLLGNAYGNLNLVDSFVILMMCSVHLKKQTLKIK